LIETISTVFKDKRNHFKKS